MNSKILLVDDNITIINIISSILKNEGYEVHSTTESSAVVEMAKNIKPDIILLDIVMPVMDGFEVCAAIKKETVVSKIPVIILTAERDSRDLKKALELGAIDYIRKPSDSVEIIARVESAIKMKRYREKLEEMAFKDSLTGLYNHAAVMKIFQQEYQKLTDSGKSISFIMLDLDYFKKINDTYGHTTGDAVLRDVSGILAEKTELKGIAGRYGGEEFAIVLPDTSLSDTGKFCEELRQFIENHNFHTENSIIKATVSIGFCHKGKDDDIDDNKMVEAADQALYNAKHNGRNRVEYLWENLY